MVKKYEQYFEFTYRILIIWNLRKRKRGNVRN